MRLTFRDKKLLKLESRFLASGSVSKELGSYHSSLTIDKKTEQMEKPTTLLLSMREERHGQIAFHAV